jgi:carbonic anhydrase
MNQRTLCCIVVAAAVVGGLVIAEEAKAPAEALHWDYGTEHGPAAWGKLDSAWAACSGGKSQSPIDIPSKAKPMSPDEAATAGHGAVTVGHDAHLASVLNNGHTVQVNYGGADTLALGSKSYSLVQYHFHGPSEHTVDGKRFPMEMHLVHKADDGKLAVIGVLIEEGAANAAFEPVWTKLPKGKGDPRALGELTVDVDQLLPQAREAYWYNGSLTTPPCSEGVRWFVLRTPIQLSKAQIQAFKEVMHGNNRPTQPLHGRKVTTAPLTYR